MRERARLYNALPLYGDIGSWILLTPDGELLGVTHDRDFQRLAEPEKDRAFGTVALVAGAERYPELKALPSCVGASVSVAESWRLNERWENCGTATFSIAVPAGRLQRALRPPLDILCRCWPDGVQGPLALPGVLLLLAACATTPGGPAVDDTFVVARGREVSLFRVTPTGLEGQEVVFRHEGDTFNGPLNTFHVAAGVVEAKNGVHIDVQLAPQTLHMKGYWTGCLIDLTLDPKALKGNVCGQDVDLGFDGESYTGQLQGTSGTGATARGISVHVPRIIVRYPPEHLAFGLLLTWMTRGPMGSRGLPPIRVR